MLAKKLVVRSGSRVAVVGAPDSLGLEFPADVTLATQGPADVVLVFAKDRATLDKVLPAASSRTAETGILWVAYPKGGQLGTDLNRDSLARALSAAGLEPVSQIAVDDVWSALRVKRDPALAAARKARGTFDEKPKRAAKPMKSAGSAKPTKKTAATAKPTKKTTASAKPTKTGASAKPTKKTGASAKPNKTGARGAAKSSSTRAAKKR